MPIPSRPGNSSLRAAELAIGLAIVFLIAGGFLAGGGRGRVTELGAVACAILLGWLAGPSRAMFVAVLGAGAVLGLEAKYDRLGSAHAAVGAAYALGTALAVLLSGRVRAESAAAREDGRPLPGTLDYESRRALRYGHPLTLLLVHADGSSAGPSDVVERIAETMRSVDFVAGRDGPDLWLLLPETTSEAARIAAERLRLAAGGDGHPVSIGAASFPEDGDSPGQLGESARKALSRALELGGNRTVLHTAPIGAPPGWGLAV